MNRARLRDLAAEGLRCRWASRRRSALAVSAIAVGILSLTLVSAVIDGLDQEVRSFVGNQLGEGVFLVRRAPSELRSFQDWKRYDRRQPLTLAQFRRLQPLTGPAAAAGAMGKTLAAIKVGSSTSEQVEIRGLSWEVPEILTAGLARGRWFSHGESASARPICVLGADVAEELFGDRDPLGESLHVLGRRFTVVGVAERQGELFGSSQDSFLAMPLSTFLNRVGRDVSLTFVFRALPDLDLETAQQQVRGLVRRVRRLDRGAGDDFTIESASDYQGLWSDLTGDISRIALTISAVASLVGGLVIMNVLLIDVARRKQEIGLRRSVGARRRDIMGQVLTESAGLTLIGGVAGLALGYVLAALLDLALPVETWISPSSMVRALAVSLAVGLAAGLMPALRAVRVDPIEALRGAG